MAGKCWRCSKCGWVDCYSDADLAMYGEPTECQDHYHEALAEIDLADGWAALTDKAVVKVRQAERALNEAKRELVQAELELASAQPGINHDR